MTEVSNKKIKIEQEDGLWKSDNLFEDAILRSEFKDTKELNKLSAGFGSSFSIAITTAAGGISRRWSFFINKCFITIILIVLKFFIYKLLVTFCSFRNSFFVQFDPNPQWLVEKFDAGYHLLLLFLQPQLASP